MPVMRSCVVRGIEVPPPSLSSAALADRGSRVCIQPRPLYSTTVYHRHLDSRLDSRIRRQTSTRPATAGTAPRRQCPLWQRAAHPTINNQQRPRQRISQRRHSASHRKPSHTDRELVYSVFRSLPHTRFLPSRRPPSNFYATLPVLRLIFSLFLLSLTIDSGPPALATPPPSSTTTSSLSLTTSLECQIVGMMRPSTL